MSTPSASLLDYDHLAAVFMLVDDLNDVTLNTTSTLEEAADDQQSE
jgi:hypothetical protein